MKTIVSVFAVVPVVLLGAGLAFSRDERPPRGSYLETCSNVSYDGRVLQATCLNRDGRRVRTSLANPDRCRRDIANINGTLMCK